MKINVFEGARRIVLLVQALWIIGVVVFVALADHYVSAAYVTTAPPDPFVRAPEGFSCGYTGDAREYVDRITPSGTRVSLTLCFQAMAFPDGRRLVPFRQDTDGHLIGHTTYSSEVTSYTSARAGMFVLPTQDAPALDQQWWRDTWGNWKNAAVAVVVGCIVIWVFSKVVGWIVRGFMSIPMGRDARP